ncbi:MAG: ATP-binding cassette domain-containing protein, partial [Thermomicrobia bacterium]|nr:ATP-binding cassette domain-containing protein [Thermomicrobia bacterium]
VNLSGGQKQRVAIARALLLNPRILVLDDATSSVDMETEYEIQQALNILMEGRTTFIIAQRLSSVRTADQICVLHDGEIVERGTHAELLALGGRYRAIYDVQTGTSPPDPLSPAQRAPAMERASASGLLPSPREGEGLGVREGDG